jgi:hypothetical protein
MAGRGKICAAQEADGGGVYGRWRQSRAKEFRFSVHRILFFNLTYCFESWQNKICQVKYSKLLEMLSKSLTWQSFQPTEIVR